MAERTLAELDVAALVRNGNFSVSPQHWEDEVLYFLMLDRFSDGKEKGTRDETGNPVAGGTTEPFSPGDNGNAVQTAADAAAWSAAGQTFVGGTLGGLRSKLGYLKRLGVTVIWISPIFKQVPFDASSYHGYGIQHFLDVDSRFGTRDQLKDLVRAAHALGIKVILDIILNHTGDVFEYQGGARAWTGQTFPVRGFRDATGKATLPFGAIAPTVANFPDAAIWPSDFQTPQGFTRQGSIGNFDFFPEFADGDFFSLKDLNHGDRRFVNGVDQIDAYAPSATLRALCDVYKFWIAFADIDGYRLDTVKHMDPGATRFFAGVIHEFAEALGKDNFYIIGEITGGREFAFNRLEVTGLDAALGISDERVKLIGLFKGETDPSEYFDLFRNSVLVQKDSHVWFKDKVVTSIDDHDHVDQGGQKHRFSAGGFSKLALPALAMSATTLGIPCLYYGSEQLFDGEGGGDGADRYIRESMFGGGFGAFRSKNRHFFDENQPTYVELAKIHGERRKRLPLRRGRQFLRQISGDGVNFGLPRRLGGPMRSVVAWSRIFNDEELLCALNTDPNNVSSAFVTIDDRLHETGSTLECVYSTAAGEMGKTVRVEARNGKAVKLSVPPAGFAIYA
jgi:glycosidase